MELNYNIYSIKNIDVLLDEFDFIKNNKGYEYANIPCVIDIESSSFYLSSCKQSIMYAFVIGINGKCIIGRTYEELKNILYTISSHYVLSKKRRMIFYVHNLSYEFQFFRKWFNWEQVFALEERKVVYALTDIGIELRCSYILSGYNLAYIGENLLTKYKVKKMVGDLDYKLIRHKSTILTEKELGYILNDGLVVMAYIQEEIERNKNNINYLQLTKTGKVRDFCRKRCLYTGNHHEGNKQYYSYRHLMSLLKITSIQEYNQLKRAFSGGFTHANAFYVGKELSNVTSYDFTSSYPSVMICEKYPMSTGKLINVKSMKELRYYMKTYCVLMDATFINISSTSTYEHSISESKCYKLEKSMVDNGRIVDAELLSITLTEQDFYIIEKLYKWEKLKVKNVRIYRKDYLPTCFIKAILDLYSTKTTLKGVEEKEIEYLVSKENLNSCYGMCVTGICRDELEYIEDEQYCGGWKSTECDYEKAIQKYNNSKQRFLCYQWGVWVTAYARRNLFNGICAINDDYVYADTDSIKFLNADKHKEYFIQYNKEIELKLEKAMQFHNLPISLCKPLTKNNEIKILGVWDYDGFYLKFKTLGAKRYMVKTEKGFKYKNIKCPYSLTISGLSKFESIPYLYSLHGDDIMNIFQDGMFIPKEYTGKNTHTYLDFEQKGYITDYLGKTDSYYEKSSIHLEECEYELSMTSEYLDLIYDIQERID